MPSRCWRRRNRLSDSTVTWRCRTSSTASRTTSPPLPSMPSSATRCFANAGSAAVHRTRTIVAIARRTLLVREALLGEQRVVELDADLDVGQHQHGGALAPHVLD